MSCPADLSTMTDAEAHAACEALRSFLRIVPLSMPEPAERGVNPSPFGSAPAGEGTTTEVIA